MKTKIFALLLMFAVICSGAVQAQQSTLIGGAWHDLPAANIAKPDQYEPVLPDQYRLLELDFATMNQILAPLSQKNTNNAENKPTLVIELPMPQGGTQRFRIFNDPIMHPDLAKRYPEIQTMAGQGVDDPKVSLRLDLSPHGFNAQILSEGQASVYIAPVAVGDNRHHISYFKAHHKRTGTWTCGSGHVHQGDEADELKSIQADMTGTCGTRREYRLALACTGEYAAFHGGTVALALAAMNTTMNRVNGVYQREVSVRMNLIANTDELIYLDGDTDPYTNDDGSAMLGQNQTNVDMEIGAAGYDIGHVFSTAGGGIASLSVPCTGSKARGVTGQNAPIGDLFDIDFVAHEIGHQFGARHTFNEDTEGSCGGSNMNPSTAFEPGSGSTIMAYAGICGSKNVQGNSDDYFHAISLFEIVNFVQNGAGNTCGTTFGVANAAPTANAGNDYTIPVSTPFRLTANGNDTDGNPLQYCWEQMDNQVTEQPPLAGAVGGPMFRSFDPTASATRYFPNLATILAGNLSSTWEVLPNSARNMNFRVTTRDGVATGGCTGEDDMTVTVSGNAGPFRLTSIGTDPNCLYAEDQTQITWDVANTNAAPINCSNVDIWLSLDNGQNFNILLANDTPNDGMADVFIPASAITTQGRIMLAAADNIFFDINNDLIRIDCPLNITVTDNPASGTYRARNTVTTSGDVVVLSGTVARFYAGQSIVLRPGFQAQAGSDFVARPQVCNACVAAKESLSAITPVSPVSFYENNIEDRSNDLEEKGSILVAYPNPFQQKYTLRLDLISAGNVDIQIFDLAGRMVQQVVSEEMMPAGTQWIEVESNQLANGVYTCRMVYNGTLSHVKLMKI